MQEYDYPWKHIVIDNFFDKNEFENIRKELIGSVSSEKKKCTHSFAQSLHCGTIDIIKNPAYSKTFNFVSKKNIISFLEYFRYHRNVSDNWKYYWEINQIRDSFKYPKHYERENKVLSMIVYVDAEDGNGTLLYDENRKYVKEVDFVPNRALVFCGINNVTWHSYFNLMGTRTTLNGYIINDI